MFSWFQHDEAQEPKKDGPFKVSWYRKGGPLVPGAGSEISTKGLVFTTAMPPPDFKDFAIEFEIREKKIHARVKSKKPVLVSTPHGLQHKFACTFSGISADDWDLIVRYINNIPEAAHSGSYVNPNKADDDFRTLPTAVQRKIIADLVEKERLEEPDPGVAPLIRMSVSGEQRTKEGASIKRFTIHSRILAQSGDEEHKDFDTKYAVDEHGNVTCLTEVKKKK